MVKDRGRLRFPLILFARWFAAQGLIGGTVAIDDVVADDDERLSQLLPAIVETEVAAEGVAAGWAIEPLERGDVR